MNKSGATMAPIPMRVRTYQETVTFAILMLAEAIEAAFNKRDWPMLEELRRLSGEIFQQADQARAEMEAEEGEKALESDREPCEN